MKVTWVAYSRDLNPGKLAALTEQARRLGRVRAEVWQRYGSVAGARLSDRQVRDTWMADRTHAGFGVTRVFAGRRNLGRNMNRRLAAWTKGLTAEALSSVPERRGSALVLVNAAYTSQADPVTGTLGVRKGDRLYCESGDVYDADHAAAINILQRASDPDITLHTPHTRVKQILQERADRQRARLPVQDSSPGSGSGERNIRKCSGVSNE